MDLNDCLFVIPARKGSSFKGKNRYPICGKSLVNYTLDAVKELKAPQVLVTTDDHYIKAEAEVRGFMTDDRPAHLANDIANLNHVMYYVYCQKPSYATYVCLPPTSPLRNAVHIKEALEVYSQSSADSLISVKEEFHSAWKQAGKSEYVKPLVERLLNRQQVEPFYIANGAIFICSNKVLYVTKTKVGGRTVPYVMSEYDSVDIHGEHDIELAELILRRKR